MFYLQKTFNFKFTIDSEKKKCTNKNHCQKIFNLQKSFSFIFTIDSEKIYIIKHPYLVIYKIF